MATLYGKCSLRRFQFEARILLFALGLALSQGLQAQEPDSAFPSSSASDSPPTALSPGPPSDQDRELTLKVRFHLYLNSLRPPESLVRPVLAGAYDQAVNTPSGWGQGAQGLGRRVGSGFAAEVTSQTIEFGVAAADHEDIRFHPSHLHGVWPRTRYAIVHTFLSPVDGGGQTFAFSRISAIYGSAFIANAWYPAGDNRFGNGLSRGTTSLGLGIGYHVLREFAPDLKKKLLHHE